MSPTEPLGHFEQLVLAAVLTLEGPAYGISVHARVQELARPRRVSLGAVYVTLDRLEDKGLLTSQMSDPSPERGGRAKRVFRMQAAGERALRDAVRAAQRISGALEGVWGSSRRQMERA